MQRQPNVYVLNTTQKREHGRKAQLANCAAAKAVADVIRTCLGPRAMLKMMLDPMGGIAITNDGNAILREVDVQHPAARSIIELSRAQDESVGDGTTSVVILAGELLTVAAPYLDKDYHPTQIIRGYASALDDALAHLDTLAWPVDVDSDDELLPIVRASISTKFIARWHGMMCRMALRAVRVVRRRDEVSGRTNIDIKRYVRVERVVGGELSDSCVIDGVMLNKDVTHAEMRRRIERPRILLLDCPLEYKKGESKTDLEISKAEDWTAVLEQEETHVRQICEQIIALKPDVVITEKGCSDLAQHYFVKAGITAFRRAKKTDNVRLAAACGATIAHRPDEATEKHIGTRCGLMEVRKLGDEYYVFFEQCEDPHACTVLLRGASRDVLKEIERNLQDAMATARNIMLDARLVAGGGAVEMSLANHLTERSKSIKGVEQWPYRAVAVALEVIPRTLADNCGTNAVRALTELRAMHAKAPHDNRLWGIDGETGKCADMKAAGIVEPLEVKAQVLKAAVEAAITLLRVDDILSGGAQKK